jgi:hypothetical protein
VVITFNDQAGDENYILCSPNMEIEVTR